MMLQCLKKYGIQTCCYNFYREHILLKFKIKKVIAKSVFSKLYSWSLDYFARVANALENHANARAHLSVCWSSVRDTCTYQILMTSLNIKGADLQHCESKFLIVKPRGYKT